MTTVIQLCSVIAETTTNFVARSKSLLSVAIAQCVTAVAVTDML